MTSRRPGERGETLRGDSLRDAGGQPSGMSPPLTACLAPSAASKPAIVRARLIVESEPEPALAETPEKSSSRAAQRMPVAMKKSFRVPTC